LFIEASIGKTNPESTAAFLCSRCLPQKEILVKAKIPKARKGIPPVKRND
jgi:hypothetical protein